MRVGPTGCPGHNDRAPSLPGRFAVYPSGRWEGFWQQVGWGRQSMREFTLTFADGKVTGRGRDVVGRFTYAGEYDETTGRVVMVKDYPTHRVVYVGQPDGEGCIQGTWTIEG